MLIKKYFHEVDISSKAPANRLAYLIQNGQPFFTIIYTEGHVFLYIGNYPKTKSLMAMSYQNVWEFLNTTDVNTRSIIGGAVFLPLLLQYPKATDAQSFAARKYFNLLYLDQIANVL